MRFAFALLLLPLLASPAPAQDRNAFQGGAAFSNMSAQDAARLNEAVRDDPQARQALDQAERKLNDAGHRSGQLLEKTRP